MPSSKTVMKAACAVGALLLLAGTASCKKEKKHGACDPAGTGGCPDGEVCEAVGNDEGMCMAECDPAAADPCGEGVCFRYPGGVHACTPTCGGNGDCNDGWICAPVAAGESICRPECTPGETACPEGEVCQPLPDGTAVCTAQCDPLTPADCGEAQACELRTDDAYACYDPVYISGMVFDSSTGDPIEGAHVIAADKTGASATDVAVTDAAGRYELQVPVERNPDGTLFEGVFTLRVSAADYLPYPHGIRPAIPVDAAQAVEGEGRWDLSNASTDVALIPLPVEQQGQGSISGAVSASSGNATPAGVLVVIEGGAPPSPFGFSDRSGAFTVFNIPAGTWQVHGYKAFLQLDIVSVTLAAAEDKTDVVLPENAKPYGTITGNINIVNPGEGSATTVVLVPVSTYSDTFTKGEVPPGLREPPPPEEPSLTGGSSYSIEGVPDGTYKVLAAFENDKLVRDPDPNIAGTQIVEKTVPEGTEYNVNVGESFKITGALVIVDPGETEPELVTGNPTFIWTDDSSEDHYSIVVYNAYGDEVMRDDAVPRVTGGSTVEVPYAGTALVPGMYYQFRAMSWKTATATISQTEDLLGVFYTPAAVE
jgi:hypothetical protein